MMTDVLPEHDPVPGFQLTIMTLVAIIVVAQFRLVKWQVFFTVNVAVSQRVDDQVISGGE